MKTFGRCLLLIALGCTGCLGMDRPMPRRPQPAAQPQPELPPEPLTAEQVTPETAHQTIEALRRELDRAEAGEAN
jgi:hypothetical protein